MSNQYLSEFQIIGGSTEAHNIRHDFVSLSDDENIKRTIDVSHSVPIIELIDDGETFSGIVLLQIKSTLFENKKKYPVELTIGGRFNAPTQIGEDTFKGMLRVNGVTALYGIARGFVQSTTSQTLLSGSVLLPMFNVAAYSEDIDENGTEN